jgi:hypothetical protein
LKAIVHNNYTFEVQKASMACLATLGLLSPSPRTASGIGRCRVTRCILDRDDELSKRASRRPHSCTEDALYASKRRVDRLMARFRVQHRQLVRSIQELERERVENEAKGGAHDAHCDVSDDEHALKPKPVLAFEEELLIDM